MIKFPLIVVTHRKDYPMGWEYKCPYCKKKHLHGEGLGHRAPHCTSPPLYPNGYYIVTQDIADRMQGLDDEDLLNKLIVEKNRERR